MYTQELHTKYTQSDLQVFPGNIELRYKLFAPILQNLHDYKIIYQERFIVIAKIERLIITPKGFKAKIIPYLKIYEGRNKKYNIPESWSFGAVWDWVVLSNTSLNGIYAGWSIWCEPEQVKSIEKLALNNQTEEALNAFYKMEE